MRYREIVLQCTKVPREKVADAMTYDKKQVADRLCYWREFYAELSPAHLGGAAGSGAVHGPGGVSGDPLCEFAAPLR